MNFPEKKLGFGFMRMPLLNSDDQAAIDVPQLEKMVDKFFERGFTYCDTAWMYHDFMSEPTVGKAVVSRYPRDSFTIATKMPVAMLHSHEEGVEIFEKQKEKLGVDYFDFYLVHDMGRANYENAKKYDMIPFLREKKEAGEIRCLGFSCHDNAEFLDQVLTENPFFEFVQLQINYLDWENEGIQSRKCYEVCVKHNKPVIVMEPVKGGTLAKLPDAIEKRLREARPDWSMAQWAIRFAASLENVKVVLSGMSNEEQLEDNTTFMKDFVPLTDEETKLVLDAAEEIRQTIAIPCTGCRYCVEESSCPKGILIPNYFALYNTEKLRTREDWSPEKEYYANFVKNGNGKASDCIACKKCERVCPQHIKISEWMPKLKVEMEDNNYLMAE
ncbi:MAG: aldo/keto reductase [Lachnospiraceae bacterium]|nr:aldo/keto reductase [Lachnospiraceae bacterium]